MDPGADPAGPDRAPGPGPARAQPDALSDEDILAAVAVRTELFGVFFDRHYDAVLAYFASRVASPEAAADLCAETLAAALAGAHRFDPSSGIARQWLFGIARNKLRRYWRDLRVDTDARSLLGMPDVDLDDGTAALIAVEAALDGGVLRRALDCLPDDQRQAVWLRVVEELDYDEIARRLRLRSGTVRVRVHRGLRRLRTELEAEELT